MVTCRVPNVDARSLPSAQLLIQLGTIFTRCRSDHFLACSCSGQNSAVGRVQIYEVREGLAHQGSLASQGSKVNVENLLPV